MLNELNGYFISKSMKFDEQGIQILSYKWKRIISNDRNHILD